MYFFILLQIITRVILRKNISLCCKLTTILPHALIFNRKMTASTSQKAPCATCGKVTGMFTCRGCQKDFCTRHVAEHRQELGKQMDELTLDHDRFRQNLIDQTREPRRHPLIKQIDEWEEQSINTIRRSADDARQQLRTTINDHATKLTEALTKIAQELRKAREDDDFFETDLKQWIDKLDRLRKDLAHPPNIQIRKEVINVDSLALKIIETTSTKETFARSVGSIQIEDGGQVIVKKQGDHYQGARGSGEYSSGQHRFRFKIEECINSQRWIFIGIVSKDVTLVTGSYGSQSSYGWAGATQVYCNGALSYGFNGYKSDMEKNDVVELLLDCDQRMIRLTNERTRSVYGLPIEISKCPFPWQLNFNLYFVNDRIRILQT